VRIAVISDSHDNLKAVERFQSHVTSHPPDLILHAGDIVAPFTARLFLEIAIPIRAVYGNNDGETGGLASLFTGIHSIQRPPFTGEFGGRKIFMVHDLATEGDLIRRECPDVVIHGHTHRLEMVRRDGCLYLNPGELGGWVTGKSTFMMLETENVSVEKVDLEVRP